MRFWPVLGVGLGLLFGGGAADANGMDWGSTVASVSRDVSCQGEWARRLGPGFGSQCVSPPAPRLPGIGFLARRGPALEAPLVLAFPASAGGQRAAVPGLGFGDIAGRLGPGGLWLPEVSTAYAIRRFPGGLSLWFSGRHALLPEVSGERPHEATAAIGLVQQLGSAMQAGFRLAMTRLDGGRHAGGVDYFGVAEVQLRRQISQRFEVGLRYGHWKNQGSIGLGDFTHDRVQVELGFQL